MALFDLWDFAMPILSAILNIHGSIDTDVFPLLCTANNLFLELSTETVFFFTYCNHKRLLSVIALLDASVTYGIYTHPCLCFFSFQPVSHIISNSGNREHKVRRMLCY